tara:strand:+ start:394 stop:1395 length:1002 start_codon:yes stop_codon:yes gene_type:complete
MFALNAPLFLFTLILKIIAKNKLTLPFFCLMFCTLINTTALQAAEITTNAKGETIYFILQGDIEEGDLEKLAGEYNILVTLGLINDRPMKILLNSRGGNLIESMRIGRFVRTIGLVTMADKAISSEKNAQCLSACFFIFVAGKQRDLGSDDTLGVHRPYFDREYFGNLTATEAEVNYKEVINKVTEYLDEMGVRENVKDIVLNVSSDNVTYFSVSEFNSLVGLFEPHFEEWLIARCTDFPGLERAEISDLYLVQAGERFQKIMSKEEFETYTNLPDPNPFRTFSKFSEGYKAYLKQTDAKRKECISNSIVSEQANTAKLLLEIKREDSGSTKP